MNGQKIFGSIDFFLGKALNDESFRFSIRNYIKGLNPPSDEYAKIISCLSEEIFSFEDILRLHGQKTTSFAIEIANKYANRNLEKDQFVRHT